MLSGIVKGMGTTLKVLFKKKTTIPYPEVEKPRSERWRGRHELRVYDDGLEMCIGCELCQVACPAHCISVLAAENDPEHPHAPGERYGYKYQVDLLRCIFCGLCEEACPTSCLHLTQEFVSLSDFSRQSLVYQKERLVGKQPSRFSVPMNVYPPYHGRVPQAEAVGHERAAETA